MATAVRLSPGLYRIDGKTYRGKTSAEAMAAYNAAQKKTAKPASKPAPTPGAPRQTPVAPLPENPRGETIEKTDFTKPKDVAETDVKIKKDIAVEDTRRANPNEVSDFGQKTVTYDPVTGQPTVTTKLVGENKALVEGQQKTGTIGTQVAGNLISNVGSYDPSGVNSQYAIPQVNDAYMQRYQQAAYDATTRNLEKRYAQEKEQKAQELVNRGIPQGSPQFQAEMNRDVEDRFNEQRQAAENNSYAGGLNAGQANFGMGLQANQAANQNYNTSFGNKVAWGSQLNNIAQGQQAPNQAYTSAQTQGTDIAGIHNTTVGAKTAEEQIRAQKEIARINASKRNSGGGGSGQSNQPAVDL